MFYLSLRNTNIINIYSQNFKQNLYVVNNIN